MERPWWDYSWSPMFTFLRQLPPRDLVLKLKGESVSASTMTGAFNVLLTTQMV